MKLDFSSLFTLMVTFTSLTAVNASDEMKERIRNAVGQAETNGQKLIDAMLTNTPPKIPHNANFVADSLQAGIEAGLVARAERAEGSDLVPRDSGADGDVRHLRRNLMSRSCKSKSRSKSKEEDEHEEFKFVLAISPRVLDTAPWEGGAFGDALPGESASVHGLLFGLEITFSEPIEPFDPLEAFSSSGDEFLEEIFDYFGDLIDGITDIEPFVGVVTGVCTKGEDFYLLTDNAYCNYGFDYITFDLDLDEDDFFCDPFIGLGQLRAAGTVINLGIDIGLTPITGTSYGLAGHVDGGNVAVARLPPFIFDGPTIFLGFVPFTKESAVNLNDQLDKLIVFFQNLLFGNLL